MNENDGTEKRAILAIVLSLAVFWLWSAWIAPQGGSDQMVLPQDGASEQVAAGSEAPLPSTGPTELATSQIAASPELPPAAPAAVATGSLPEETYPLVSSDWTAEWSSRGGVLRQLQLPQHPGPYDVNALHSWLFAKVKGEAEGGWKPYNGGVLPERLLTSDATLGLAGGMDSGFQDGDYVQVSVSDTEALFERVAPSGLKITKHYRAGPEPYQGRFSVRFSNTTEQPMSGRLWVGVGDTFEGKYTRFSNFARPASVVVGDLEVEDDLDDLKKGPVLRPGQVSWLGIASRYFLTALVPLEQGWGQLTASALGEDAGGVFLVSDRETLAPGGSRELEFMLYAGPKGHAQLKELGHDLEKSVQFGFFGFFAKILYWLLVSVHGFVGNWGLAIIVLTLLVKGVFFPLTQKSFRSQQEMKKIQPLMTELKEKYKDDREMQAQEQMRLFKEHGVNPMSGCLPMVIQMPIWFALYSTLLYSVDLYRSEFLLWQDLSAQDPFAVLPILVGVLMLGQQWMTPMAGVDPMQQKMFRLMPLIFIFIMFSLPSGLCLYITINSVLTILQQLYIRKKYGDPIVKKPSKEAEKAPVVERTKESKKKKARRKR